MILAKLLLLSLTSSMLVSSSDLFKFLDLSEPAPVEVAGVCGLPVFSGSRLSNTLAATSAATMADFDNDGRLDIALRSGSGGSLWIQRGLGNGYFGAPEIVDTNLLAFSFLSGDFNNDGNTDLFASNRLYLGVGNGTFSEPRTITLSPSAAASVTGDFNGDDNLDIAASLFSNGTYEVYFGNGTGGFSSPATITFSSAASSLEAVDVNADGLTDYAVLLGTNTVSVAIANPDGTYAPPVNYPLGGSVTIGVLTSGDVDSDGDRDIVGTGAPLGGSQSFRTVLLNNGAGSFTVQTTTLGGTFQQTTAILGDVDSDGDLDLINNQASLFGVSLGNNNGTFQAATVFPGVGSQGRLFFEDVTGDGIRDLASASGTVPSFMVYPNTASGMMGAKQYDIEDDFFSNGTGIADFNEDGKNDVIWINDQLNMKLAFGNGTDGFGTINTIVAPKIPRVVMVPDFNNDGHKDIVLIAQNNGEFSAQVVVYLGNGNGTFQPFFTALGLAPQAAKNPLMADIDGDGIPDLITQDLSSRVYIYQSFGNGFFIYRGTIDFATTFGSMTAGDFDQDGRTDLAILSFAANVYLNRGNWGWEAVGPFPAGSGNVNLDIATADFNNDGIPDLATSGVQSGTNPPGKVNILLGVGKGGFSAPRENIVSFGPGTIDVTDFDGDGNKDIAISNSPYSSTIDNRVAVMFGDGQGNFPRITYTAAATNPRYLAIGDFNSDNNPDITVVDHNLAFLTILYNSCLTPPPTNLPALSANADIDVNEGDSSTTTANITVTLSAASSVPVRVRYYTTPQAGVVGLAESELFEASARLDYQSAAGELTFMPGETSKSFQIVVQPDLMDEFDEKFNIFLRNATNASITDNRTVVTIIDNDNPPTVSIGNVSAAEGNSGTTAFPFQLSLSAISGKPVLVQFQTGGGTAIPDQDYVRTQGIFTVPAGQLTAPVTVNVNGDLTFEANETFLAQISQPVNATLGGTTTATATIQNDDVGGSVQFSSATYTTPETVSGVNVTINRTGGIAGGVSVRFRTQAGTALPGQDYTDTVTTVFFADNETSRSVFIPIIFDQLDEPDETVNLVLDQPNGVTIGSPATAVLTIEGTTALANLSISDAAVKEGDSGTAYLQFYLRLSRPVQRQISVNFATADGTATAGSDYQATSGTAMLVPGMTRRLISVPVFGDFLPEVDETVFLNLSGVVNAVLTDNQGVGNIQNDEIATSSTVKLLSANPAGDGSGNTDSYDPYLSAGGTVAVFESYASNLTGVPDPNGVRDVFVRNVISQSTQLVSINRFGTATGNSGAAKPFISADGRVIAFDSGSVDLVTEGAGPGGSAFIRDLQTNQTRIVSVNTSGAAANGDVLAVSGNGRFIVFQSADQGLTTIPDSQNFTDVFVRDMQTNVTQLVSVNSAGTAPGNASSGSTAVLDRSTSITPDGRYVFFASTASDLVSTTFGSGPNLYVRDLQTQTTTAVSVNAAGTTLVGAEYGGSISDNGRYVVFTSGSSAIVANDTNNFSDVFRRDLQTATTQLVSVNVAGTASGNLLSSAASASANGRYVAFSSQATNLTTLPIIAAVQVYRRDMDTGTTQMASVNSAATGGANNSASRVGISGDGQTVFFTTHGSDLVPGVDQNNLQDIYLRDFIANNTKLVSTNESGTRAGNGGSMNGSISNDGNIVGFTSSSSDIVSIDTNGFGSDAYAFIKTLPPQPIYDFDGDGKSDLSVFRPSSAVWYVQNSGDGSLRAQQFGLTQDVPVPRDYDGDSKTDIAVFREGVWYVYNSRTNTITTLGFGQAGDIPVPGDFDGDSRADFAIYRQGQWQIRESSDGNVRVQAFGIASDVPAVADFDGDRRDDIAVFRDGVWFIIQSHDFVVRIDSFGSAGDKPVQGDFDGDRKADLAVYRPSIGAWYILNSSDGTSTGTQFGIATDIPLRADFDGDRKNDMSIFRNGVWYVIQSSNNSIVISGFGLADDIPLPR